MDATKEQEIIAACHRGHSARFAELYDAYIEKIYRFIYFRTNHRQTAEDLTSATFIKAFEHIKKFSTGSFSSWLYRIARNTVIDHYRTAKKVSPYDDLHDAVSTDAPDVDADRTLLLKQAQQILGALAQDHRDIVMMRLWDDLPYARIAELTGKSEGNCKMIVSRSLHKIRKAFPLIATAIAILLIFLCI